MKHEDIEKLLGGYATGTLTDAERQALFEAALANQALFDALAKEEALKELLDDPRARRHLLAALETKPKPFRLWLHRPAAWTLAGGLAAAAVAAVFIVRVTTRPPAPREISQIVSAPAPASPPAAMPPAPEPAQPLRAPKSKPPARSFAPPEKKEAAAPPPPPPPAAQVAESRQTVDMVVASPKPQPLIRYAILRRGPDGEFSEVAPSTVLDASDALRLSVESRQSGYLSILQRDAGGNWQPLASSGLLVEPGKRYLLPETGAFQFPAQQGEKRLLLVLSNAARAFASSARKSALPAREAEAPKSGAVGGVVSGRLRSMDAAAEAAPGATVEITLTFR